MHLPLRRRATASALLPSLGIAALAAVLALGSVFAGPTPSARAETTDGPEVTWGVRTAPAAEGEERENYEYRVEPGESVRDALIVSNYDSVPLVLDVYAADGFTTSSGQLDAAMRDVPPRLVGAWVRPDADRVTVQPGESIEVPFILEVPDNATPGDHAGAILTTLKTPQVEDGVTVDRRLGIRILLRVGGEIAPAASIDDLRVDYEGTLNPFGTGAATVSYTVTNSGNTRLSAAQAVAVAGPLGLFPADAAGTEDVPELLPGESWPMTVHIEGVAPSVVLTARVTLSPEAPSDTTPAPAAVEASSSTLALPWTLAVLILIVGALIALAVRRRRAAVVRRTAAEDLRVQSAVAQALRERDGREADASVAVDEDARVESAAAAGEPAQKT